MLPGFSPPGISITTTIADLNVMRIVIVNPLQDDFMPGFIPEGLLQ
jgi:hypothetical protein